MKKPSAFKFFKKFAMKIALFHYGAGIVTPLSIRYDDCRCPRRRAPAADGRIKN